MSTRPNLVGVLRSRTAAWGIALAVIFGVAWSVSPEQSRASEGVSGVLAQDEQQAEVPDANDLESAGPASLGELVGRDTRVLIHAGINGPTYTLIDATGRILDEGLDAKQLRARYPDVTAPGPDLMLVEDLDTDW